MRFWTVPILAYHRIGQPKGDHVPTVAPETFEGHLRFLARRRCQVWELSQLAGHLIEGRSVSRNSTVITFDDGYEETCTVAAPLLRRFGFRATVFVTPTEVGLPGFMTWEQLRAVSKDGLAVGSHTLNHTYLPLASPQEAERELAESKRILETQLGCPVRILSYPVGGFTPEVQAMARGHGYLAACTTNRGTTRSGCDPFALRRIKMTDRDRHPWLLAAKLSGYYDLFRRIEPPS
ncbi:MAG TPA: hypothetical protein DDX89_06705 [Candidatus Omnitrophica bacterium]|nr:MAG: hypothetical protein A2Z92_01965 [Omnitrophica WOR_2 bacterium GWA2_63_20]OGX31034.1 MAG: hypothetical protein A3E56_02495 [Omnitrophica WOR_2 bacterium RIFCSPHIGHO2_12_FULL_64_13]OHC82168.1 MAG: hypothetical protein A3G73_03835 [Rhodospirillales bacterium RIFCSPLOWO2_12_FULL_67_15]HBH97456.1 hypothetical protein [Candidatus Omnitrophota bacterium]HBQ37488.1 hypothetical protein [Candidatus Omnitrophota bacterium]